MFADGGVMSGSSSDLINIASDTFIKTAIGEIVKHLITTAWPKDTEQGIMILSDFENEEIISKFSKKSPVMSLHFGHYRTMVEMLGLKMCIIH